MATTSTDTSKRAIAAEARRRSITEGTARLFLERGYSATTMSAVADAAQITKRTLYRYFESKDSLLDDICRSAVRSMAHDAAIDSGALPGAQLRQLILSHVAAVSAARTELMVAISDLKYLPEPVRDDVNRGIDRTVALYETVLTRGMGAGLFAVGDARLLARGINSAILGLPRWYDPHGSIPPSDLGELIVDVFTHGVLVRPGHVDRDSSPDLRAPVFEARREQAGGYGAGDVMDRIFDAATDLFSRKGFCEATSQDIADQAGLPKGTLYYYIASKEELLLRVHETVLREGLSSITHAVDAGGTSEDVLRRVLFEHIANIRRFRSSIVVFNEELKYLSPASVDELTGLRDAYTNRFVEVLSQGVASGELRLSNLRVVSLVVLGMLNMLYRWYTIELDPAPEILGDLYARLVLTGVIDRSGVSGAGSTI